jgi:hypothetical protein
MALGHSPQIVTNGLVFYVDPSNSRSYSGFGNTIYNMVNSSIGGTFVGYTSNPIDNTFTRSIVFNGSSNYLNFPNAVNDTLSSFTIETVVKVAATNKKQAIISTFGSNLGWGLEILDNTGSNKFNFFGFTSAGVATGTQSGSGVLLNQTYHVTGVFNASRSMDVYVNGVLSGTLPTSFSSITKNSSVNLRLGEDTDAQNVFFQGNLYFAKIYNRALTASEILQNYNATKKKYSSDENIITDGLVLNIDPSKNSSYPGTGNTIYDLSGSGINGTLINSPSFSTLNGEQINMPGSSKYIDFGQNFNFTSENFSISQWIYLDSFDTINNAGQGPIPFFKGDFQQMGYYSQILSDGGMVLFTNQGGARQFSVTSAGILTTSAWYNLSCVRNGSSVRLYINGIDKTSTIGTHINPGSSNQSFKINYYKGDYLISGQMRISQFLIYNRALSAQEVLQNYNATKNRFINALPPVRSGLFLEYDATIVASYPGTGTTWFDISGNRLNGTLTNGPVFSSTGSSSSIAFDGTNDFIDIVYPRQINTGSPITLSLWAKWITTGTTTATIQTLVDNNYQTSPGSIGFFIQDRPDLGGVLEWGAQPGAGITRCTSTFVVGDGKWHHITATNDGSTSILYIDGAQSGLARTAAGIGSSQPFINLGRWRFTQSRYLNGNIADFRIFNRALSAYEVKQNFDFYRTRYGV